MGDVIELGTGSVLGTPEGEDAATLRDRLDLSLRYISNWYRATKGSSEQDIWWAKIDQTRAKVEAAYRSFSPNDVFLSVTSVGLYNDASMSFASMWRELYLSPDTVPKPDLLDVAAGWFDATLETPGYLLQKTGDVIARAIGGTLGTFVGHLWPYLLIAAMVFLIIEFHGPIVAALS